MSDDFDIEGGDIDQRASLFKDYERLVKGIGTIDHFCCNREAVKVLKLIKEISDKEVEILGVQSPATLYEQKRIQKLIEAINEYGIKED